MRWMLNNSDGNPDALLTLSVLAFLTVAGKVLLNGFSTTVFGHAVSFGTVDASLVGSLLTPTLAAYTARRWTERKHEQAMATIEPCDNCGHKPGEEFPEGAPKGSEPAAPSQEPRVE